MTKILSQSEVAAIRERAAKATLGPWERHVYQSGTVSVATAGKQFLDVCHVRQVTCDDDMRWREVETAAAQAERRANAVFVAASRADVPALCDTVDALRAKLEVAKAALQGIVEYWNGAPESAVDAIETVADRAHNCLAHLNTLAAEALGTKGAKDGK